MSARAVSLLVVFLAGCATGLGLRPAAGPETLKQQVADTERGFARSMAERDLKAFRSFLSRETIFFSGEKPRRGPDEVVGFWQRFYKEPQAPFSWEPQEVEVLDSGTLALSSGPVRDPQGKVFATYTSIWRLEEGGQWRIVFDKGNPVCPPKS